VERQKTSQQETSVSFSWQNHEISKGSFKYICVVFVRLENTPDSANAVSTNVFKKHLEVPLAVFWLCE
jgi:hypothetical protein